MNKKGTLGLNVIKAVMITFLVLAVIGVAVVLTMTNIRDVAEKVDIVSGSAVNESVTPPAALANGGGERNPECTITAVYNSSGSVITSGNYTEDLCVITNTTGLYNATAAPWKVSYDYKYSDSRSYNLAANVSDATTNFFTNTSTIFAILVVVVIILAIAIIIAVVTRFGGVGEKSSSGGYGSDTVSGV